MAGATAFVTPNALPVRRRMTAWHVEVGALVLLAVLLGWALATPPITARGEAREGLVVRDILEHGHWVIAWRDGTLASKPPLFHWIAAACARVFGLSEVTLRLPSLLAAIVFASVPVVIGSSAGATATGWLAVAMLGAMPPVWASATEARVDMVFAAAVASALAGFFVWDRRSSRAGRRVACAALAAAVLAKGPVGAILPLLAIGLFLAWERRLADLRSLVSVPLVAALVVVATWYAAASAAAGPTFVTVQVLHENVHRLFGGGDFAWTVANRAKLAGAFATHLLPWNLVLPWSVWRRWRGRRLDATDRFLHAWWIAVVGVFALAARTRSVYLLPAYPAVAMLAARALAPYATRELRATLAAAAVLALGTVHASRLHAAHTDLPSAFAARIRPHLSATSELRASASLPENDALVLRWLLDRSLVRAPLACAPDAKVLVPLSALARATALGLRPLETAGTPERGIALADCPRTSGPPARATRARRPAPRPPR